MVENVGLANDFKNATSFEKIEMQEVEIDGRKIEVNTAKIDIDEVLKGKRIEEHGEGKNPFNITFPCMDPTKCKMVPRSKIVANNYNPNSVPKDKMDLLATSVKANGFCFPIVTVYDKEMDEYIIVDGFHRFTILGPSYLDCPEVPCVVLDLGAEGRLQATVQFNRARGVHKADSDADLVRSLVQLGESDEDISKSLGMTLDEVKRYKTLTGVLDLFKEIQFSRAMDTTEAGLLAENTNLASVNLDNVAEEEKAAVI